ASVGGYTLARTLPTCDDAAAAVRPSRFRLESRPLPIRRGASAPPKSSDGTRSMNRLLRPASLAFGCAALIAAWFAPAAAQDNYVAPEPEQAAPADSSTYQSGELVEAGHRLFGDVSQGLASVVEHAIASYG